MADFGAIHENVQFNWDAATKLAAELRATADTLDGQVGPRTSQASTARRVWEGVYAGEFDGRVRTCTGDATRLAASMRRAAAELDSLAELARAEQQRREYARDWVANHDDSGFWDNAGDFFFGEDDLPPPRPPIEPPSGGDYATPPGARGPAAPAAH